MYCVLLLTLLYYHSSVPSLDPDPVLLLHLHYLEEARLVHPVVALPLPLDPLLLV